MKILLAYYHPVIFDLAETFSKLSEVDSVDICVSPTLSDNYGGAKNVLDKIINNKFLTKTPAGILAPIAHQGIRNNYYDLVGLDGVFDGDQLIMDLCRENRIPYFCINGYPHQIDEPSQNILAFSWHLPQVQYKQTNPHEGYVKEKDWKNIALSGQSEGKNIFVFYPEMNEAKRFYENKIFSEQGERPLAKKFVSLIHRYSECNQWSYHVFDQVNKLYRVENYSDLTQAEAFQKIWESDGLVHLKHGDCPGISVLEALILGRPVITMESFVKASFNQEVLIDGFNSIVCKTTGEMLDRMRFTGAFYPDFPSSEAVHYIHQLTSFNRQRRGLSLFLDRCLSG